MLLFFKFSLDHGKTTLTRGCGSKQDGYKGAEPEKRTVNRLGKEAKPIPDAFHPNF